MIGGLRVGRSSFSRQRYFSYPLLFHDDPHAFARNRSSDESSPKSMDYRNRFGGYSILAVKRLISRMRRRILLRPILRNHDLDQPYTDRYLHEGVAVVLEFTLSSNPNLSSRSLSGWNCIRTLHSIPLFMEHRYLNSNLVLDLRIPYLLHTEILIRLLRRRIRDVPFLHLLGTISHNLQDPTFQNTSSLSPCVKNNRLFLVLWNYYSYEFENLLVLIGKRFSQLRSIPYIPLVDRIHYHRRVKRVIRLSCLLPSITFPIRNPCIHFVRYGNNCILAFEGSNYSARKWIHYLLRFWQCNHHSWLRTQRIRIIKSYINSIFFLGYTLGSLSEMVGIKAKTMDNLSTTHITFRVLCPKVPTSLSIRSLAREGFCNGLGFPISRSAWATSTDTDTTNRFNRLWKNLFIYYSGSSGLGGLYRIRYILRFSCAKTLACKHKSTIRAVWKRFGSRFNLRYSLVNPYPTRSGNYLHNKRFWCLDVSQNNPLIHSVRDSYK